MNGFVNHSMYKIMTFLGRYVLSRLRKKSKCANSISQKKLIELLHKNKNTEYGKKYNFENINSYEDFKTMVPITTYSDYDEYIKRMLEGETNIITSENVNYYADSSGSTGNPKRVPVTKKATMEVTKYTIFVPFGIGFEYMKKFSKKMPSGLVFLMQEYSAEKLSNGKDLGCITEIPLKIIKPFLKFISATPLPVIFPADIKNTDMKYLKMRFSIDKKNVVFINAIYGIVVYEQMRYLEDNWEMLCDDIEKGIINKSVQVPDITRNDLKKYLKPNPERAAELRSIFKKGFDIPIIPAIWPKYFFTNSIFTGSFAFYIDKLKKYVGEDMAFSYSGYGASECIMAVVNEMNNGDFSLIQDGAFYEFISDDGVELLTMDQLTVGSNYELVITNLSGLYRYRMSDIVTIKSFMNELPIINFIGRKDRCANIIGEKTTEEHFSYAVKGLAKDTDINVIDYSIWVDKDLDLPCYIIFIEIEQTIDNEKELDRYRDILESKLSLANDSIPFYIKTKQIGPLKLCYLKKGTYSRYFDMLNENAGTSNQIKPIRIIEKIEIADFFSKNCI